MADEMATAVAENEAPETDAAVVRIYEVGYHITPAAKEGDLEKIVGTVRGEIEKAGGSFIAEGAPALIKLSYPMKTKEGDKIIEYDRGYFGWVKFEAAITVAHALNAVLTQNPNFLRFIVFQTVREDTRAKMKAPQLREVKRTDIIKAAPRRVEESAAPISEAELEKAIQDITAE